MMSGQALPSEPLAAEDALERIVAAMAEAGTQVARVVARGGLGGELGAEVGQNTGGDAQKAIDVIADEIFTAALAACDVRFYASEERDEVVELNPAGRFAVAIDPLDGSSNIDVNISVGTIFSVYPAAADGPVSFLRPAAEQVAAGYLIYGPQTCLAYTLGRGAWLRILDPDTGRFAPATPVRVPARASEFAINSSNYRHWSRPIRAYIDDCLAGAEGPRAKDFNMRWVASLVAEAHRILVRGGIFLYPADQRPGYEKGRLRLLYECAPIAFLMEQAGGAATDGHDRILGRRIEALHGRTPFVFGTTEKVDRVAAYHDLPEEEVSALFGNRGLFRA
jgi:fructose-1,6-bisphosphatase I